MLAYLTRRRTLACAHRYYNPNRDPAWNRATYGPLTNIHGHNYTVDVTVCGELDPVTGIVVNLVDVKEWLRSAVEPFENEYVDVFTPVMEGRQPSTENLATLLWRRLASHVEGTPARLHLVRVAESDEIWSEYLGKDEMVYVTRVYDFSAAHRLYAAGLSDEENFAVFGKCSRAGGHGHNYILEITVKGHTDAETGFAYPLDRLDEVVNAQVLDPMDHRNLNTDIPEFARLNPTSENLAVVIWNRLSPHVGPALHKIKVHETLRNSFEYLGE